MIFDETTFVDCYPTLATFLLEKEREARYMIFSEEVERGNLQQCMFPIIEIGRIREDNSEYSMYLIPQ